MFDKFARIDSKKEAEAKKRVKPVEINQWHENKNAPKEETLTVSGDVQMDMDLNYAIKEHEQNQDHQNGI